MLTISTIKNSAGAAIYYTQEDNYYLAEVATEEYSQWWGAGAAKLGLTGKRVEVNELQQIMEGKLPNGVTIGLRKDGSRGKHRAGHDLCFHAPKSVSILALGGGDKRFYAAHLEAVKETLKVIEADCAQARIYRGKEVDFENTKNLAIALIRHTASRSMDPHLHSHALVMNATEREDQTWKALASSMAKDKTTKGFMELIYHNQIYYGLIYRSTLANRIQELGCEIEIVGRHGMWEIKGVPKEAIETMSKRRQEIEGVLNKLNYHSFKAADIAALDSRAKKPKNLKWAEMRQTWQEELAKAGFSAQEFLTELERNRSNKLMDIDKGLATGHQQESKRLNSAIETVKAATWQLSQYELKLDYPKIISQALEFAMGKTTHGELVQATNQLIKEGFLIPLDKSDTTFVTQELIETEKAIMDLVDNGKKQWSGFITLKDKNLNGNGLGNIIPNESQKTAIDILQSKQRLSLVETKGADHRELMAAILVLGEAAGKQVKILSPNRLIANDINENVTRPKPGNLWQWLVSLGRPEIGDTLAGFIHKYREEINLPAFLLHFKQGKDIIIVNHAETPGISDLRTILELTEKSRAKVIFLRDVADKHSLGSGNSLETLKQAGIERFRLTTPALTENLTNLTDASSSVRVMPELKAIRDNQQRTVQLAKEYAQREDRENCVVLVNSKNQLKTTNEAIRRELKEMGKISSLEHQIPILSPVYLSPAEATLAHKYQQNMVIRFYHGVPEDWQVVSCNRVTNTLRLVQGKRMMAWNPKQQRGGDKYGDQDQYRVKHGIFKKETLLIAQGDRLIAAGNMRNLGIKNGTKFTVRTISDKSIELLGVPRKTRGTREPREPTAIKINLAALKYSHFQYDYATTINRSLKRPVTNIIADFKAYSLDKPTIDGLTKRAQETLTIFTNDGAAAQRRFGHVSVRLTAVETVLDASLGANRVIAGINNKTDNQLVRTLTNKTISEIKADLEKALGVLKAQYEFRSQDEVRAVEFALAKITSHHAGFEHRDLVKETLTFTLEELISKQNKAISLQDIERVIAEKQASGELVLGKPASDGIKWTTKEQLELERAIITDLKQGAGRLESLLDPGALKNLNVPAESIKLTQDQKNAIDLILTTKDQYVIIQGYAGTGKTTIFKQVHQRLKEAYKESGKKVTMLGVAPTHKAKRELEDRGIKAQSLKSFLLEQKRIAEQPAELNNPAISKVNRLDNKLIILDEASMASTQDLLEFIKTTSKSKAHAVISGDMAQLLSIDAGKPHEDAVKSNVLKVVHLKEIVRQETPNLKSAVESTIKKDYAKALEKIEQENPQNYIARLSPDLLKKEDQIGLENNLDLTFFNNLQKSVIEIDNNKLQPYEKTLEQVVADDYLTRTPEIRDKTVIIVHANKDRAIINSYIREGLKKQGVIAKSGLSVNRLTAKGFSNAEYRSMKTYSEGDVLKLKNVYYRVMELDLAAQSLLLKEDSGKTRYFYPDKEAARYHMELYRHTREELAVGDVIRLTKTDKKRGLFANFEYKVKELNDKQAVLESIDQNQGNHKKQSQLTLNHRRLKDSHWDYAYTVTGYGVQGASKEYAIDVELSYRKALANVRSFYVGISRAIKHLIIYTDNKDSLLKQLLRNPGDKYSALEVVGELPGDGKVKEVADTQTNTQILTKQIKAEFYNLNEIKQSLQNQAEAVVESLLGKPNKNLSTSREWRYSNKGSLAVSFAPDKRGLWKNFETGEGGRLLELLQKELGLNFRETLKYAADRYGGYLNATSLANLSKNQVQIQPVNANAIDGATANSKDISANVQKSKTSDYAQKLFQESLPISGTMVEKYLKEHRGIKKLDSKDIRYHPKVFTDKNESQKYLPAMLSIGRDKNGEIQCVQATYLDLQTANKAGLTTRKRTYASPSGALVSLQERQDNQNIQNNVDPKNTISFIAEGTETGLSVKDATRNIKNSEVVVTLGKSNFSNIDPQSIGDKIIFCLDHDGPKTFADNTIHKAVERLINHGKEVYIAIPQSNEGNTKVDFNDVARASGVAAVSKMLENFMPYQEWVSVRGIKMDPTLIEEVMRPKALHLNAASMNAHSLLPSRPELDLNLVTKFIDLKKDNLDKYLDTYNKVQRDLSSQKITETPKISLPNVQKDLSKIEKELY